MFNKKYLIIISLFAFLTFVIIGGAIYYAKKTYQPAVVPQKDQTLADLHLPPPPKELVSINSHIDNILLAKDTVKIMADYSDSTKLVWKENETKELSSKEAIKAHWEKFTSDPDITFSSIGKYQLNENKGSAKVGIKNIKTGKITLYNINFVLNDNGKIASEQWEALK